MRQIRESQFDLSSQKNDSICSRISKTIDAIFKVVIIACVIVLISALTAAYTAKLALENELRKSNTAPGKMLH